MILQFSGVLLKEGTKLYVPLYCTYTRQWPVLMIHVSTRKVRSVKPKFHLARSKRQDHSLLLHFYEFSKFTACFNPVICSRISIKARHPLS
jgi:hypothetical protein